MRYIAAYLLLKIAGKESPSAADIKKVIESVGIRVEDERLDSLLSELDGKDINAVRFLSLFLRDEVSIPFHSSSLRALVS
jgi:ribosomal protein L12E/L44/L45/RPP1/RPP2